MQTLIFVCQHMGAQLGQEISKPLWTVDRCSPSLAVFLSFRILSPSQTRTDQTVTCGNTAFDSSVQEDD